MDERSVEPGRPVGDGDEAPAALLRRLHQADDLGKQRPLAHRLDLDAQRARDIDRAGEHAIARNDGRRRQLAGDQARVQLGTAAQDGTVGSDALAGGNQQLVTDGQLIRLHAAGRAVLPDDRDGSRTQRQQAGSSAAGGTPRPGIEKAPDQEEEEQREGAVEIDMRPAAHRLDEAHRRSDQDRQRDRHIHVGVPGADAP